VSQFIEQRKALCKYVIDNNVSLDDLRENRDLRGNIPEMMVTNPEFGTADQWRAFFFQLTLKTRDSCPIDEWIAKHVDQQSTMTRTPEPDVLPPVKQGTRSHLYIPDTQQRKGVPSKHLEWIGEYIVDRNVDVVVHGGDHWDMPSLNPHRTRQEREGMRYEEDVEAGNETIDLIRAPARRANAKADFHLLRGNHEEFINDAIGEDPKLEGQIGLHDLKSPGWTIHNFLDPVWLDGICYSHYFYHPMTGKPWTGTIDNRLKQIGHSFTMGHQQTFLYGIRYVAGRGQHGLVAGSCYLHDEDYKGPQGNAHWRGVIVKHEVRDGDYDIMAVSLDFLCRKYEGMGLEDFKVKYKLKGPWK